jgi:hypothetical protein
MRMYRSSAFSLAALMLAACAEEPDGPVGLGAEEVPADLALVVPTDISTQSIVREVVERPLPEGGPARSEHLGYGTYPEYEPEPVPAESGIFNAQTRANFLP